MLTEKWTNNFIGVITFEKEAKKHKEEFITAYISVGGGMKAADMIGAQKEQSYQEGAEFGYNKANERLTKAKKLLTRFIMGNVYFYGKETGLVEKAEQFLRELEE